MNTKLTRSIGVWPMAKRNMGGTPMQRWKWIAVLLVAGIGAPALAQQTNQFHLASQFNWAAAKGFFFVVEGVPTSGQTATLQSVRLTLGVGDGHTWNYLHGSVPWKMNQPYHVEATISGGNIELRLDGRVLDKQGFGFVPANGSVQYNQTSSVQRAPANYAVTEKSLKVQSGHEKLTPLSPSPGINPKSETRNPKQIQNSNSKIPNSPNSAQRLQGDNSPTLPIQLRLLNPGLAGPSVSMNTGQSVTIDATFEFGPKRNLRSLSPFIDKYGQCLQADWPGKVRSDSDLAAAQKLEKKKLSQWGIPKQFDQYGGLTNSSWKQTPTGFFHLAKHDGKDWLITPMGNPCFYIGMCSAPSVGGQWTPVTGRKYVFQWLPPMDGQFAPAWLVNPWNQPDESGNHYFSFNAANLIRKWGRNWQQDATRDTVARLHTLGFSGFGKWSQAHDGVADLPVLFPQSPKIAGHPDVFDPVVRRQLADSLRRQIEPRKDDPWLLGWSVGNEHDEEISPDEITKILSMNKSVPARQALVQYAAEHFSEVWDNVAHPQADDNQIEQLREYYENALYSFLYKTIKSIDPNHLYFGSWVTPNWWVNQADWKIDAANCDVVGYDWYGERFASDPAGQLINQTDKPVLCGEFSSPPTYDGRRGYGTYHIHTETDAQAGAHYAQWIKDAANQKNCVGVFYFEYRDQAITGRGPGNAADSLVVGEDYAFGLVDVTDRIKWDLARQMRAANLSAAESRLKH